MPGGKPARAPDAVLARPLSLASYPVATGRPRPAAPSRTREADRRANRGGRKSINLNSDPGGPSRSSSIAPAETILAAADSSAPTRQGLRDKEPARNAGVKARPSPRCCFGATPLVGELPRSNGQTTAWPAAPTRTREADRRANRGARKSVNLNPGGPSRSSSIAPAETINLNPGGPSRLRRGRFFGTHAPKDKENQPEKCRSESTPEARCCFGATPLVGELPRSNGQTTAWPAAPPRVREAGVKGKRGARKSINLNPGGPSRSSSIAPAETINLNA